jgi:hypothetical protein
VRIEITLRRTALADRERGHSLVEVLFATMALTMVVVGLYGSFSFGFATIKIAQEDLGADQLMVQKLETLRTYDWSKITSGYIPTNTVVRTNAGTVYDVTVAIDPAPLAASYSSSLRQVTVSLLWYSGGVPRHRSMTTLVSQNGIQTYKP